MEIDIPKIDLPEAPTNADLAKAIQATLAATVGVHTCLEDHRLQTRERDVVISGQIKGINDQLDPNIPTSAIAKINATLEPISTAWQTYQKRKKWFLGAVGSVVIALSSSAATGIYNALTTQHIADKQTQNTQTVLTTAANLAASPSQYNYATAKANWDNQRRVNEAILQQLNQLSKRHK